MTQLAAVPGVLQQMANLLNSSNMQVQQRAAEALLALVTAVPAKQQEIAAAAVGGLLHLVVADSEVAATAAAAVQALAGIAKAVPCALQAISKDTAACARLASLAKEGGADVQKTAASTLLQLLASAGGGKSIG
jgi:hypothetical protein